MPAQARKPAAVKAATPFDVPSELRTGGPLDESERRQLEQLRALADQFAPHVVDLDALTAWREATGDDRPLSEVLAAPTSAFAERHDLQGEICPAHFPDGFPEGEAAVTCQHGDEFRHYYRQA